MDQLLSNVMTDGIPHYVALNLFDDVIFPTPMLQYEQALH